MRVANYPHYQQKARFDVAEEWLLMVIAMFSKMINGISVGARHRYSKVIALNSAKNTFYIILSLIIIN